MNRRDLFKGAFASFFAFMGAKLVPAKSEISDEEVQRLASAILNAHLDQLALGIHKPIVRRRYWEGTSVPRAWRYKGCSNIVEQAFKEVNEADVRVQQVTGKCDLNSFKNEDYT